MFNKNYYATETAPTKGASVTVTIDVTKIVKYVAIAGVMIVGIIFGSRNFQKMLSDGYFDKL